MVLSSIYFLDLKGKVLLSRDYRGDISPEAADRFMTLLSEMEEQQVAVTPIITINNITYVHIRHANLYGTLPEGLRWRQCPFTVG